MELKRFGQEVWSETWENMDTMRRTVFLFDNGLGAVVVNCCMGGSEVTLIKQLEGEKGKYTYMLKDQEIATILELARWLVDATVCERVCDEDEYCHGNECVKRVTDWLKQPAKEEYYE